MGKKENLDKKIEKLKKELSEAKKEARKLEQIEARKKYEEEARYAYDLVKAMKRVRYKDGTLYEFVVSAVRHVGQI